jgi:hypothetical protein
MAEQGAGRADNDATDESRRERALAQVRTFLQDLRFGTVTIVVHDGIPVQIEKTERLRLGA